MYTHFRFHTLKTPINIRLGKQSLHMLNHAAKKTAKTKTEVVEEALEFYYKERIETNPILQLAGTWSDEDTKAILTAIKTSRVNSKDIEL